MKRARALPALLVIFAASALGISPGMSAVGGAPPQTGAAAAAVRLILRTGQPGLRGGTYTEFSDPSINAHGDLVFGAITEGGRVHEALYTLTAGHLRMLVADEMATPAGGRFWAFNDVLLNDRGTVVFLARTTDRAVGQGLYFARGGRITPILVVGQAAPTGGVFTDVANPTLNNEDLVAFVGRTTGPGQEGIFTSTEGGIVPVVMAGQAAPDGGAYQFFLDGSPALNDRGQIAFVASTTERETQAIYAFVGNRPVPLVTTDDESPVGGPFTEFGSVVLSDEGTIVFIGRTTQSAVRGGLYITGRAQFILLARQGQDVGGTPLGAFANAVMNNKEQVVFQVQTPDPVSRVIYLATRAGVRQIVKAGDAAPGGGRFTAFSTPDLNDDGQLAFVAETNDGRHGIYMAQIR
jgi:hypothetical protein